MKFLLAYLFTLATVFGAEVDSNQGDVEVNPEVVPEIRGLKANFGCDMPAEHDAEVLFMIASFGPYSDLRSIYSWQYAGMQRVSEWLEANKHQMKLSVFELANQGDKECVARTFVDISIADWAEPRRFLPTQDTYLLNTQQDEAANVMVWYGSKFWSGSFDSSKVRRLTIYYTHKAPHFGTVGDFVPNTKLENFDGHCPVSDKQLLTKRQFVDNVRSLKTGLFVYVAPKAHSQVEPTYNAWKDLIEANGLTDSIVLHRDFTIAGVTEKSEKTVETLLCPSWIATTSTAVPSFSMSAKTQCFQENRPCSSDDTTWETRVGKCIYGNE